MLMMNSCCLYYVAKERSSSVLCEVNSVGMFKSYCTAGLPCTSGKCSVAGYLNLLDTECMEIADWFTSVVLTSVYHGY